VLIFCGQGKGEFFKCGNPHLLGQKTSDFLKFMVSAQQGRRGVEPMRSFCRQGERGLIFRDFVQTFFMDGSFFPGSFGYVSRFNQQARLRFFQLA